MTTLSVIAALDAPFANVLEYAPVPTQWSVERKGGIQALLHCCCNLANKVRDLVDRDGDSTCLQKGPRRYPLADSEDQPFRCPPQT